MAAPLSLVIQTVVVDVPALPAGLARVVHVLSYVLAGVFLVLNRHLRGLWLLGLGVASNAGTIALNGGTLPADPHALAVAGIREDDSFANSGMVARPSCRGSATSSPCRTGCRSRTSSASGTS